MLASLCLTITWHDALEVLLSRPRGKALLFLWPRDVPHAHAASSLSVPVVTDTWSFPCLGCCEYCCSERRGHVSLPARVCISWRRVPRIGIAGSRGSPAFNFRGPPVFPAVAAPAHGPPGSAWGFALVHLLSDTPFLTRPHVRGELPGVQSGEACLESPSTRCCV